MISIDSNVLLYSLNAQCPEHAVARQIVSELGDSGEVVICELVLVELYVLLRNPAVVAAPLVPQQAVEVCQTYRRNPRWQRVEAAPVMDDVWERAAQSGVARRRIFDARLALTLRHHGVTELVTRNTSDFAGFGFARLNNPFEA